MVYWLLVPVRLSGNPSQQRRTTLSRLSSTSIPILNQTQPAKTSRPILFQAGVVLRPHPPSTKMRTAAVPRDDTRHSAILAGTAPLFHGHTKTLARLGAPARWPPPGAR